MEMFGDEFLHHFTQFTENYDYQQQQLSRHSSSTASLRSLSTGSPDCSSLPPITPTDQVFTPMDYTLLHSYFPPHAIGEHEVMTRAMTNVISSSSSNPYQHLTSETYQKSSAGVGYNLYCNSYSGAFALYDNSYSANATLFDEERELSGQRMIKRSIGMLRGMGNARMVEARPMTSNQMHHMISERKRREKLNDSFNALRMLLPSGSKKDKVSVLLNAKNHLCNMKERIRELKERNQMLETQLQSQKEVEEFCNASTEPVQVHITSKSSSPTSKAKELVITITLRIECEMIDLVLKVLECLKKFGVLDLVSVEGSSVPRSNASDDMHLKMQVKAIDCDNEAFKEAVMRSIHEMLQIP